MSESFDEYTAEYGADCLNQTLQWSTGGAMAGTECQNHLRGSLLGNLCNGLSGALWGTVEAAFMEPVKTTVPLIVPALGVVARNAVFYGQPALKLDIQVFS